MELIPKVSVPLRSVRIRAVLTMGKKRLIVTIP